MPNNILFSEKQQFRQGWLILLMTFINGIFVYGIYQQLIKGIPFGDNPMSNLGLIFVTLMVATITFFLFTFRLETLISREKISIRFFPFHRTFRDFYWKDIHQATVRQYSPISEYGGWGIRFGANGKAYNVSGNMGLQLEFRVEKKLLIGTKKPDEINTLLSNPIFTTT